MLSFKDKKLLINQSSPSEGNYMLIDKADRLIITISGTSTSFTLQFTVSLDGFSYYPIEGNKVNDILTRDVETSTKDEAWDFDVSAWKFFKAKLSAIGNGNITVEANSIVS